jgi:hypothetical protein
MEIIIEQNTNQIKHAMTPLEENFNNNFYDLELVILSIIMVSSSGMHRKIHEIMVHLHIN